MLDLDVALVDRVHRVHDRRDLVLRLRHVGAVLLIELEVRVQREAFAPERLLPDPGGAGDARIGASCTFLGHVRADDGLTAMEIEHYPGMTEAALERFAREAADRFGLLAVRVIHRNGRLAPGEVIMGVSTAAPHRPNHHFFTFLYHTPIYRQSIQ